VGRAPGRRRLRTARAGRPARRITIAAIAVIVAAAGLAGLVRLPGAAACVGGSNQRWTAEPDGSIRLAGKCLDVAGYGTASGTPLDLYTCKGSSNQRWAIVPEGPIGSELVNPASGKCLADAGDATANGSRLTIQACQAQDPGEIWHVL
jgi:hypothetical protein